MNGLVRRHFPQARTAYAPPWQLYVADAGGIRIDESFISQSASDSVGQSESKPTVANMWCLGKFTLPLVILHALTTGRISLDESISLYTADLSPDESVRIRDVMDFNYDFVRPTILEAQLLTPRDRHIRVHETIHSARRSRAFSEFTPYYLMGLVIEAVYSMPVTHAIHRLLLEPQELGSSAWFGATAWRQRPNLEVVPYLSSSGLTMRHDAIDELIADDRWVLGPYLSCRVAGRIIQSFLFSGSGSSSDNSLTNLSERFREELSNSSTHPFYDHSLKRVVDFTMGFMTVCQGFPFSAQDESSHDIVVSLGIGGSSFVAVYLDQEAVISGYLGIFPDATEDAFERQNRMDVFWSDVGQLVESCGFRFAPGPQ